MSKVIETLDITSLTDKGDGIASLGSRRVFVAGALPGETVTAELFGVKAGYAQGQLLEVLQPSPARREPFCRHSECGGCQLGTLDYQAQLEMKAERVGKALAARGLEADIAPCLGMSSPLGYRNKSLYNVLAQDGVSDIGFFKKHSHQLVAADDCPVQGDKVPALLAEVRRWMHDFAIQGYNEAEHSGQLRGVMVREGRATGQWMLVLVALGDNLPGLDALTDALGKACPWLTSLVLNINPERGNRILGHEERVLLGSAVIEDRLGGLNFALSGQSFFQINPEQTEKLYATALDFAALTGAEQVFDLYCGIGTISLLLAKKAKSVVGIELVEQAIIDARANAERNGISNAEFHAGKAELLLAELNQQGHNADVVLLDPPRKGCDGAVLDTLLAMAPATLVYVSCDPDSLARDLAKLCAGGYRIDKVQPVDMFPHSLHVETVVRLVR